MGLLFLLLTVTPVVELWLLIRIGSHLGALPTLALVLLTGAAGARLAHREGGRALMALNRAVASGDLPTQPLLDAACVFVGGALLITPGVLTDLVGLALLLPLTRRPIQRWLTHRISERLARGHVRIVDLRRGDFTAPSNGGPAGSRRVVDATLEPRDGDPRPGGGRAEP